MPQNKRAESADQLAEKPGEWASFFSLLDTLEIPADFMVNREILLPDDRGERR